MEYRNIPILFTKEEITQIREIVKTKIKEAKKDFCHYVRANEEIDIKYEIKECIKGYYCTGQLYYDNKIVRNYDNIDELFSDLNSLELNILLKQMNDTKQEEYIIPGDEPKDSQKRFDKRLEKLWDGLEDIPFYEKDGEQYIEEDYFEFQKGTAKEDIWHWFDKRHSKGVHFLLYEYESTENENYTEEEGEEL